MTGIFKSATLLTLAVMLLMLAQSCGKSFHSEENGSVSVELTFADPEDAEKTELNDVRLWIFNSDGSLVDKFGYGAAAELALQRYHLKAGRYLFVTAENLTDPFTYSGDIATGLFFGLGNPDSSPEHAFYGVTEAEAKDDGSGIVRSEIRRVLSELTIMTTEAPSRARLNATVRSVATGIFPARKGSDESYGLAAKDEVKGINIPEGKESDGSIRTPVLRLMPSYEGCLTTLIHITVTLPNGIVHESDIMTPVMHPSGKYILTFRYPEMSAYMTVTPYKINEWTEGWTVNGEILNPEE